MTTDSYDPTQDDILPAIITPDRHTTHEISLRLRRTEHVISRSGALRSVCVRVNQHSLLDAHVFVRLRLFVV